MSENPNIYSEILETKLTLTVLKNHGASFDFPKKAFDRICQFYGKEKITPIESFNNKLAILLRVLFFSFFKGLLGP